MPAGASYVGPLMMKLAVTGSVICTIMPTATPSTKPTQLAPYTQIDA